LLLREHPDIPRSRLHHGSRLIAAVISSRIVGVGLKGSGTVIDQDGHLLLVGS